MHDAGRIRLYHQTSAHAWARIKVEGFKDGRGRYLMEEGEFSGVWLSDRPLHEPQPHLDVLLAVDLPLPDSEISEYEVIEEGKPYREFLFPAQLLNQAAKVSQLLDEEFTE